VCGLTTEEIARAFLTPPPTLAQGIVRAKAKIADAASPIRCRGAPNWRIGWITVLHVITSCQRGLLGLVGASR